MTGPDVGEGLAAVVAAVRCIVGWLDSSTTLDGRTELTMRVLKVSEEAGEAAGAWIGFTGQNPRKGITHSRGDVVGELADTAMASLVAIASLGADPGAELLTKASAVVARCELVPARVGQA